MIWSSVSGGVWVIGGVTGEFAFNDILISKIQELFIHPKSVAQACFWRLESSIPSSYIKRRLLNESTSLSNPHSYSCCLGPGTIQSHPLQSLVSQYPPIKVAVFPDFGEVMTTGNPTRLGRISYRDPIYGVYS
jgi:hypothetical protein